MSNTAENIMTVGKLNIKILKNTSFSFRYRFFLVTTVHIITISNL
jgi:hypothetical protein